MRLDFFRERSERGRICGACFASLIWRAKQPLNRVLLSLAASVALLFGYGCAQSAAAQAINLGPQVKGVLPVSNGGFGLDTEGLTGCPAENDGVWTVSAANCATAGSGVSAIQGPSGITTGTVYLTGNAVSQSGSTFTITNSGGTLTNFDTGSWPSWLTPTVTSATTTPTLAVSASAIPNSSLAGPLVNSITGPSSSVNGNITLTGSGVSQTGNTFTFNGSCASGDCIMGASSVSQHVTQTNSSFGATVNYRGTTLATPLTNLGLQFNGSGPGYYNNNGPWAGHTALNIDFLNNSPGIDHGISGNFTDLKVGDAAWQYAYLLFYGGAYFGSDEGLAGINIKPQQVGYFQGNLTTPTVGELSEAYSGGPSGVTFLLDGASSGNSTFTGSGVLASVSLPFAQTPATAGPAYIVVWTPGTGNNATINQVLPITLAAGTGTQTFTSADFGTVNIVQGESLGVYVPTGSAPGLTTAQGLCSTATGVPVVGPITTETSDCGYPNAGSVVMQGQLAAPTKGSTTLAIANFACESHTQGCLGQAGWEWATGGTLLDMQNSTPPQATFISNAGTILNDSIAFNIGNTTVTESTAWGNVGTCTATGGQDNLSPATDTCQITLGTSPASPGSFVAGEDACMAGWYQEEVPIISVGTASGGVQSITFTTYHGWSGSNSPIMQGGPCGQFVINSNSWGSGSSGWPAAYQVLGATSTTQILLANCVVGGCIGEGTSPTPALLYAGLQYNASVSLTRTNNVVSVSAPPGHVGPYMNIFDFSIGQTINVAGCTVDTDLNGSYTITVNSYDNQNQSLGWAQTGANEGPDGTCSINMGYPEYTFYPGAFISASSNENNMIVQPNQVVWNSGDFVVEAPAAVYSESDIIDTHGQGSIPYNNESQLTLQDQGPAWVSSNINVSNGATGKTNPGNIMLVANGTWTQDFALYQAPAENGCIICEGEGNPGPGTYTPPYYLFYAGSARWLRVDPINDYFNIGNNLSVGGTVAPASISFIGGSPGSASPDTAVPSVILLGTSAIQGYNQTPSTNTVNLYATGTNVGMSIGSGTTFEGLFTASNATGQMNFAQTPMVNGTPVVMPNDTTLSVSSGTQTANSCSTAASVTITGVNTSGAGSHISSGYTSDPASLTGWGAVGGMVFHIWPSAANTAEWEVCNQTANSITYSAITFSIGVE